MFSVILLFPLSIYRTDYIFRVSEVPRTGQSVCSVLRVRILGSLFTIGFLGVLVNKGEKSLDRKEWKRLVSRESTLQYRDKNKGNYWDLHF